LLQVIYRETTKGDKEILSPLWEQAMVSAYPFRAVRRSMGSVEDDTRSQEAEGWNVNEM